MNTRNRFFILLTLAFICFSNAQKKELRLASKNLAKGDYELAKKSIESAEALFESMDGKQKSQLYFLKSKLYFRGGAAGPEETELSVSSFEKVSNISNPQEKEKYFYDLINHLINQGSKYVDKNDYSTATDYFYNAYRISKKDTIYLYYAASSSVNAKEYDKSLSMYNRLKDLGFTGKEKQFYAKNITTNKDELFDSKLLRDASVKAKTHSSPSQRITKSRYPEIIKNIALIYNQLGDSQKALESMREARLENPDDLNLILTEANVNYEMGNIEKFKTLLEYATKLDPENSELQYNLGVIASDANDFENAEKYYKRAIELNPDYVNAYINLAALILTKEQSIIEEMNNLGTSIADDIRYDDLRAERNKLYLQAIPFLESALNVDPSNYQAAKTLSNIFSAVGDSQNAKKYRDLADSLN